LSENLSKNIRLIIKDVANNISEEENRGGLNLQSSVAPLSLPRMEMSINDQVTAGETFFRNKKCIAHYKFIDILKQTEYAHNLLYFLFVSLDI
jgi:hypothetical protein